MQKINIFGVNISNLSKNDFYKVLIDALDAKGVTKVSKVNAEFLNRSMDDDSFRDVLNKSDVCLVDGRGVLWAAKYLSMKTSKRSLIRGIVSLFHLVGSLLMIVVRPSFIKYPIKDAIPGVEAFNLVLDVAEKQKVGVFIFGSEESVLKAAVKKIKKDHKNVNISGYLNGYSYRKDKNINPVEVINKTDARILFVAIGSPAQEKWIHDNSSKLKNVRIAIGEGGTLDRIANPKQMSPTFVNRIGLEWLWRLFFNKSKTGGRGRFGRFWNSVPVFMYKTFIWKVKNEKN